MKELVENKEKVVEAIARQYTGEKRFSLVVVFDNVDKRSRDVQLAIFEAAQWFKDLTRALVIVNLRDTTFEAHRDEPPLDAFINAVNFYIKSPRFAAMLRKRLDLVLDNIQQDPELSKLQRFTLESGATVTYGSDRLSEFLMSIYASLFDRRAANIGSALESLTARNARSALGMFADIIAVAAHPDQSDRFDRCGFIGRAHRRRQDCSSADARSLSPLQQQVQYVRNILAPAPSSIRPSNFLYAGHPRIPYQEPEG